MLVELGGLGPFELPADSSDPGTITDFALERVRRQVEVEADLEGVSSAT